MKIASILPYKENYTLKGAGAVALWISDFVRDSKYKKKYTNKNKAMSEEYKLKKNQKLRNKIKLNFYNKQIG